jgi:hypothetical protein
MDEQSSVFGFYERFIQNEKQRLARWIFLIHGIASLSYGDIPFYTHRYVGPW